MIDTGIEVIAPGANVPFADPEIFFGPIADHTDSKTSVIPDFISNCGMARVFGYLMGNDLEKLDDEAIFCLLYTSPSPRDYAASRMPSSA